MHASSHNQLVSAVEFCGMYVGILESIDATIKPEMHPAIRRMYHTPPEDWITPETCFASYNEAFGFVYKRLIKTHLEMMDND
jgi:hypothetical protein